MGRGDLGKDLRFAGRMMRLQSGICRDRRAVARDRHWSERRDLQRDRCARPAAALPIDRPDELFFLKMAGDAEGERFFSFSGPQFDALRAQVPEVTVVAMTPASPLQATIDERARLVLGQLVSGNWFGALGVGSSVGRVLTADDTRALGGEGGSSSSVMPSGTTESCRSRPACRRRAVGRERPAARSRRSGRRRLHRRCRWARPWTSWLPVTLQQTLRYYHGAASVSDADATRRPGCPRTAFHG